MALPYQHDISFDDPNNSILSYSFNPDSDCKSQAKPTVGPTSYYWSLYRYGVLTAESEKKLFLKMNYAKMLGFNNIALAVREIIVKHNLKLVIHATKSLRTNLTLDELISCGNVALLAAVDHFNVSRVNAVGHASRFSTYAMVSIRNAMLSEIRNYTSRNVDLDIKDFDNDYKYRDRHNNDADAISSVLGVLYNQTLLSD